MEELSPRELHAEVPRKAEVVERLRHLGKAQLRGDRRIIIVIPPNPIGRLDIL
jgi:hypothetical protein